MNRIFAIIFVFPTLLFAIPTQEEGLVDFKNIKKVIQNDMLSESVKSKRQNQKKKIKKAINKKVVKYNVPSESDFWGFASEYWLVKNAAILKWDFEKPDYGIDKAFSNFLKQMGYYEIRFKILLLNTPDVVHAALPTNPGEYIFLLSVPFMKVLDLSKTEICLILFEDLIRAQLDYFKNYVKGQELKKQIGSNFAKSKLDMKVYDKLLKKYDELVFDKGFSFQQQFEVTKQVNQILKSDLKLWNVYVSLLKKIDQLVKSNLLYEKYARIYPSPELQISWLVPKKKVLE